MITAEVITIIESKLSRRTVEYDDEVHMIECLARREQDLINHNRVFTLMAIVEE